MGCLSLENNLPVSWLIGRATTTVHYRHEYLRETTRILKLLMTIGREFDFTVIRPKSSKLAV
jgi:uncharacterized membrane protein